MMRRLLGVLAAAVVVGVVWLAVWLHTARDWHPLIALLAAVSVPVLFDAVVLGFQFTSGAWFRRRGGPESRYPISASIRAWAGEVAASLRTLFYSEIRYHGWDMTDPAPTVPAGDAGARRTPVLLVHGYFCNRGIWHPFARWLAARGHPVDSVNLEPIFGSIDDFTPIVAQGVRRLQERSGAARVAIVAHSMGGLVVRAYLAQYGSDSVCSVVTLGSPHRGTWMARFGVGRNVAQMRPDSTWLRELAKREADAAAARVPFTTIVTAHDNMVMPMALQTLEGASTRTISACGHVALAYDREVWQMAVEAIDAGCARPEASGERDGRSTDATDSASIRSESPA